MKVVLSTLNAKYIHSSLALRYLKAFCQPVGADIIIKEYSINHNLLQILGDLFREQPRVLGLACYIWNMEMTLALARLVKKVMPDIILVLGGPEVTYDAEKLLAQEECIDYIVQGEGEEILYRLLEAVKKQQNLAAIAGLVYRQNGQVYSTGPQIVANLDSIPFPYCDDDMAELKDKIIYYESSRGCPFSCQYCLSSATQGVRMFSLDRVFRDMTFFIKHNVKQVKFVDRTFNASKHHYFPLLKFLAAQQCRTNFHFEIAADILDDEVLAFLKDVPQGRFQFEIGVQSTYEPTLAEIDRLNNWPRIVHNVTTVRAYNNIHLHLDLIVGLPYEDSERFGRSFNDVYALQPHMLQIGFLKLLKGSGIRRRAAQHGYVFMDTAPYEVLANNYIGYNEIRKLQIFEEVFNQVYNSGRFRHTLLWLIALHGGDAYRFYRRLAAYWEKHNYHLVAHSTKAVYRYLLDFCQHYYGDKADLCKELLKFDALTSDNGTIRPEFLPWNSQQWEQAKTNFWRNTAIIHKYLPDYTFSTWREIKKKYHIEVFPFDVTSCADVCSGAQPEVTAVLFNYTKDEIEVTKLAKTDFFTGGTTDGPL